MPAAEIRRGLAAGAVAGTALVAAMYLLGPLAGLRPLPQLLQQPLLEVMPGALFGFLIDTLQHAGKVVEEAGLIFAMLAGLALLGGVHAALKSRLEIPYLAMFVAGGAWLAILLVLLPISGEGLAGLRDGVTVPILWAILFGLYAVVLEAAHDHWLAPPPATFDRGRRRVMVGVPVVVAGGSLAVLGIQLVPGWWSAVFNPPGSGIAGPSPELTPVRDFYVVSKNFADPTVDGRSWSLSVHGLVDRPFKLNLDGLRAMPATTRFVTLECISNNVGGNQISTGEFAGVPLRSLLEQAGAQTAATLVAFKSRDGYTESLPLKLVLDSPEILLAHSLGGAPLTDRHGFPARIVVPGHYGMKGPKWIEEIELVDGRRNGYWENQGWNPDAAVKTMARWDQPGEGQLLNRGPVDLAGIAFAGKRGISAVEFSADGGRSWLPAQVKPPLSDLTWVTWTARWNAAAAGAFTLLVRATDGAGAVQSTRQAPSYPDGSSGYHALHVSVSDR